MFRGKAGQEIFEVHVELQLESLAEGGRLVRRSCAPGLLQTVCSTTVDGLSP